MNNLTINTSSNINISAKTSHAKKYNDYLIDSSIAAGSGLAGFGIAHAGVKMVYEPKYNNIVKELRDKFAKLLAVKTQEYNNNTKAMKNFLLEYEDAIKQIDNMEKNIVKSGKKIRIKGGLIGLGVGLAIVLIKTLVSKKNKKQTRLG